MLSGITIKKRNTRNECGKANDVIAVTKFDSVFLFPLS